MLDALGPRLEWLLTKIIKPDPLFGHLFPGRFPGRPMSIACGDDLFHQGVAAAGLEHLIPDHVAESGGIPHFIPHDCRGTFINHGAIAGWSFQKIRAYTGQRHAQSIEAYLDQADGHDQSESIFRHHPLRVRRAQRPEPPSRDAEERDLGALLPSYEPPTALHLH